MPEPEFIHDRDRQHSEALAHQQPDDDIRLPSSTREGADDPSSWGDEPMGSNVDSGDGDFKSTRGILAGLGIVILAGLIGFGVWAGREASVDAEQQHPNWQHVEAATAASQPGAEKVVQISDNGDLQLASAIEVNQQSADRNSSRQIRSLLARGDLFAATAALQSLQSFPDGDPDVMPPQIAPDSELESALRDRNTELFELQLFDCCDEDGDVVEILVNGVPFATVPILHQGAKVTVPLQSGSNTVSVVGVRDGGGGITISFKTSRGNYFCQKMIVGQTHQMGVIVN
ncbi:hypothetical protein [Novipirellula artificiosorum]|uniref:Uncharacterized protein n=1 Tax=Novipirellula artificiosorum TaxID=2528016 RepID=A0A5C6DFY7_9BACT|nr:hypothetical protein [Novipirellula artificiosorum]TWU34894.1 hypothetical protein Poly41_40370 [Novipirellula artificiosorum]